MRSNKQTAIFAGGCFWCIESAFAHVDGVIRVMSGHAESKEEQGKKREAVRVAFDPSVVEYKELVRIFWLQIDPTDGGGQFYDRGFKYTTAIYVRDQKQKKIALESKEKVANSEKFKDEIATRIVEFESFENAEDAHQEYWKKYPERYRQYRVGSGREDYLKKAWGKKT